MYYFPLLIDWLKNVLQVYVCVCMCVCMYIISLILFCCFREKLYLTVQFWAFRTLFHRLSIAPNFTNAIQIKAFLRAVIECSTSCVFSQTGLVQTEEERLFIEPVGQATDSFSGWEHRVIREKHSSSDRPATAKDSSPKFCQTIRG